MQTHKDDIVMCKKDEGIVLVTRNIVKGWQVIQFCGEILKFFQPGKVYNSRKKTTFYFGLNKLNYLKAYQAKQSILQR